MNDDLLALVLDRRAPLAPADLAAVRRACQDPAVAARLAGLLAIDHALDRGLSPERAHFANRVRRSLDRPAVSRGFRTRVLRAHARPDRWRWAAAAAVAAVITLMVGGWALWRPTDIPPAPRIADHAAGPGPIPAPPPATTDAMGQRPSAAGTAPAQPEAPPVHPVRPARPQAAVESPTGRRDPPVLATRTGPDAPVVEASTGLQSGPRAPAISAQAIPAARLLAGHPGLDRGHAELPAADDLLTLHRRDHTLAAWYLAGRWPSAGRNDLGFALIVGRPGWTSGLAQMSNGRFLFQRVLADGSTAGVASPAVYAPGAWHHLAGVMDVAGGRVRLFVDGGLVAERALPPGAAAWDYGTAPWRIGHARPGDWEAQGPIAGVRIYDGILSAAEIADLAQTRP